MGQIGGAHKGKVPLLQARQCVWGSWRRSGGWGGQETLSYEFLLFEILSEGVGFEGVRLAEFELETVLETVFVLEAVLMAVFVLETVLKAVLVLELGEEYEVWCGLTRRVERLEECGAEFEAVQTTVQGADVWLCCGLT